jgi:hypothetical protein
MQFGHKKDKPKNQTRYRISKSRGNVYDTVVNVNDKLQAGRHKSVSVLHKLEVNREIRLSIVT